MLAKNGLAQAVVDAGLWVFASIQVQRLTTIAITELPIATKTAFSMKKTLGIFKFGIRTSLTLISKSSKGTNKEET